ncbi:hypothetical protein [Bartonella sp. ML70XJBT]|uniref:hypothetical protein n=1 Tax=Bartonella sp. ML70XJBT TaxID=3019096 RepID=UPI00235FFBF4|nr:hypothetical protein [Bartonella sp. ML70XJBT]
MSKKYKLTSEIKQIKHALTRNIINLYRIRALKDFDDVKAGALGGFIEKEVNLSHDGNCWVYDEACVYGHANVSGSACIYSHGKVYNYAVIRGRAKIYGKVYGSASVAGSCEVYGSVYGNAKLSYCAKVWGRAYGNAKINKKSKEKLVPQNCEVYESDHVIKIVDKTE